MFQHHWINCSGRSRDDRSRAVPPRPGTDRRCALVRRRAAPGRPHRAHARPVRRPHVRHDRGGTGIRAGYGIPGAGRARRRRRRGDPTRERLRRLLLRRHERAGAGADPARRPRRPAHVLVSAGLGVRGRVARGRAGRRSTARTPTRVPRRGPRGRARARRLDRPPSCSSTRGTQHLFADSSLPDYDAAAAACSPSACWRSSPPCSRSRQRERGPVHARGRPSPLPRASRCRTRRSGGCR